MVIYLIDLTDLNSCQIKGTLGVPIHENNAFNILCKHQLSRKINCLVPIETNDWLISKETSS